jgi:hypothetical protein
MKHAFITLIGLLALAVPALAQQDPDDPGIQDSIIIDEVFVDTNAAVAMVPVYAVIDDSVGFYNIPLSWHAPHGGVSRGASLYYAPLTNWDLNYDTSMTSGSYIRQFGIMDLGGQDNPRLITSGQRVMIFRLRFNISPNAPPQSITIDTTWDSRNMSLALGLIDGHTAITPAFVQGGVHIQSVAIDGTAPAPLEFAIKGNYPNPFNPSTTIEFSIAQGSEIRLVVYNVLGQAVKTVFLGYKEAGNYSVIWDGTNEAGVPQSSGTYFYKLSAGSSEQTRQMTLLR